MQEIIEIRVPESLAGRFLPAEAGATSACGIVRKLTLKMNDPLVRQIKRIDLKLRAEGRAFYTAWVISRRYTKREVAKAELFHVWPKRVFEPAGEECGTTYNDAKACPECGAGAPQTSSLFLDGRRIPRKVDFAQTIAGEIIVSDRVIEVFRGLRLTGAEFDAVRLVNRGGMPSEHHFQLQVVGQPIELDPATRAGEDPFDEDGYGRCPCGDVVGLNLLSEVVVKGGAVSDADVMVTRQMVGVRRGLLRPRPMLLLSPRAWRGIEDANLKGLVVEIARCS